MMVARHLILLFADTFENKGAATDMNMRCGDAPHAGSDLLSLDLERSTFLQLTQ